MVSTIVPQSADRQQAEPQASQQPILTASGVLLQNISWETYQSLVRELESQPGKRLTYDNGQLEIFMPLPWLTDTSYVF